MSSGSSYRVPGDSATMRQRATTSGQGVTVVANESSASLSTRIRSAVTGDGRFAPTDAAVVMASGADGRFEQHGLGTCPETLRSAREVKQPELMRNVAHGRAFRRCRP
jgi:hypothetical protein